MGKISQGGYMRVALVGSQSVGKSTLLKALQNVYPDATFIEEATRWVLPLGFKINREADFKTQEMIMMRHLFELYATYDDPRIISGSNLAIFDRSPLDCFVYSTWLYYNNPEKMPRYNWNKIRCIYENVVDDIDLYVYIPIEFPVVDDGVRDLNENYRSEIDHMFKVQIDTLHRHRVLTVSGTVEERVQMVKDRISQ